MEEKKPDPLGGKRIFLSQAFLVEVEKGLFGLYRSLIEEGSDPLTGKKVREKLKDIGPIGLLHVTRPGEKATLKTMHPVTMQPLDLTAEDA